MTTLTADTAPAAGFDALWAEAQAINLLTLSGRWQPDSIVAAVVAHDWYRLRPA
jgi:hypothetical protein